MKTLPSNGSGRILSSQLRNSPTDPREVAEIQPADETHRCKEWHSRGRLPHWEAGEVPQHIHFHLASDSPRRVVALWRDELATLGDTERERNRRRWIEKALESSCGECWLSDSRIAEIVVNSLFFFDGERYRLHAWVIMPNHVHVLCTPIHGNSLSKIVFGWKSFTATKSNRLLGRKGPFWREEYFDRAILSRDQFDSVVAYIEANPVRAGLCEEPGQWLFSSAAGNG